MRNVENWNSRYRRWQLIQNSSIKHLLNKWWSQQDTGCSRTVGNHPLHARPSLTRPNLSSGQLVPCITHCVLCSKCTHSEVFNVRQLVARGEGVLLLQSSNACPSRELMIVFWLQTGSCDHYTSNCKNDITRSEVKLNRRHCMDT